MMNKKSKNKKLRRKLSFVLFVAAVGVLMMRAMPGMSGKIAKIAEDDRNRLQLLHGGGHCTRNSASRSSLRKIKDRKMT